MYRRILYLLALSTALASCGEKTGPDDGGGSPWGSNIPEGYEEVSILYDANVILQNPLSGWVIYVPLIENVDEFWEKYENFPYNKALDPSDVSVKPTVNVFDYGHVLYLRGSWTDFNPEENVYIWQDGIDENKYPLARSLRLFEEGAAQRGLKLAFTLKCDSRDANAQCTPDFVKDKMVAEYGSNANGTLTSDGTNIHTPGKGYFSFTLGTNPPKPYWSPYPDDRVFQEEYAKFINALAAEYDDPEKTEFISGLGMGLWGEYHACIYSTDDETPREDVFGWVTDVYSQAFKRVPVVTNYHKFVGSTKRDGSADAYPEICDLSKKMLTSAVNKGFCMRHDAFGMQSGNFGYARWEKSFIADFKYKVPVLGEGGWIVTQGGYDENGNPKNYMTEYSDARELRQGEYDAMASAYVNMMDLRYDKSYVRGETWSWFNDAYDLVLQFLRKGCYRVYPDRVIVPVKVRNGQEYTIEHRWRNRGEAYFPANIPQYEDRFKVAFALLNTSTGEIVGDNIFFDEKADPSAWTLDGGPVEYSVTIVPEGIAAGYYDLCVGIVDMFAGDPESGDYRIGVQLGTQSESTPAGWLKVRKVAVTD